jgi:hypothetical protein
MSRYLQNRAAAVVKLSSGEVRDTNSAAASRRIRYRETGTA